MSRPPFNRIPYLRPKASVGFALILLLAFTSHAQTNRIATAPDGTTRNVVFTVLPTADKMPRFPDLYVKAATGEQKISPGFGSRGNPVQIPARERSLELYTKVTTPEGVTRPQSVCQVDLDLPSQANAQIILLRNPQQPMAFAAYVIDDSTDAFPAGTVLFTNYYPSDVAVKLGTDTFTLPYRNQREVHVPLDSQNQTRLPFVMAVKSDEGWEFRKSGRLALWPRTRMLIISAPYQLEGKATVFRVHYIQDMPHS